MELPPAPPVDFAYTVHRHRSCLRRFAGRPPPLSAEQPAALRSDGGDHHGPRRPPERGLAQLRGDHQGALKIRQFLKNLRTEESVVLGRRLLNHALGAKNIEDIPEARVKQVLADTKHENLQGLLADVGLGNAMSVMVARRMLGMSCRRKSSPNPPARRCRSRGRRHAGHLRQLLPPHPGDAIIAHISPGRDW